MASFNALARVGTCLAGRAPISSSAQRAVAAVPARRFSFDEAAKAAPAQPPPTSPPPPPPAKKRGSSFLQRLGAFLTGAGLGCGVGYYHLATEIKGSTAALEKAIAKNHSVLSDRLDRLEK